MRDFVGQSFILNASPKSYVPAHSPLADIWLLKLTCRHVARPNNAVVVRMLCQAQTLACAFTKATKANLILLTSLLCKREAKKWNLLPGHVSGRSSYSRAELTAEICGELLQAKRLTLWKMEFYECIAEASAVSLHHRVMRGVRDMFEQILRKDIPSRCITSYEEGALKASLACCAFLLCCMTRVRIDS